HAVSVPIFFCFSSSHDYAFFFLLIRPPPCATLFPYTTLFRSSARRICQRLSYHGRIVRRRQSADAVLADEFRGTLRAIPHHLRLDRKSTRLNSSHVEISYAVFCLKKKKKRTGLYRTVVITRRT